MVINAPYKNAGNDIVLSLVGDRDRRVLDVGCGAGDNARRLAQSHPDVEVVGLTHSAEEAELARPHMAAVHVLDLERDLNGLGAHAFGEPFDVFILSHVLEHLSDPATVLSSLMPMLVPGGRVIIAVPNLLEWRTRLKLMGGSFQYTDHGILDRTHLRFFTFDTAPLELVHPIAGLCLVEQQARGAVPLGPLRRLPGTRRLCAQIDRAGVRRWPNLFGGEVVIMARKQTGAV